MNRFEYGQAILIEDESVVCRDKCIKLYDGDDKTNYENGEILLTSHRLFWGRNGDIDAGRSALCLHLKYIKSLDEESAGSFFTGKKTRLILNLKPPAPDKAPGPQHHSSATFIKLSGTNGILPVFMKSIRETYSARMWEVVDAQQQNTADGTVTDTPHRIKLRTGIVGIERGIQEKQKQTDQDITLAFQDLSKLMVMAKDMVAVSKSISSKIRDRQGDISEDETVRFKSYLMSLGIDDPVTRDNYQSNVEYYAKLSQQICEMLLDPLTEVGGMMSLADVYCRVNRARGLELLSPEDLLNACKQLTGPMRLRQFPSGAMVLQLESHDDEAVARDTAEKVENEGPLTIEELARILGISIVLAQERLLTAERAGCVCRDESVEGLRFYENLFLKKAMQM